MRRSLLAFSTLSLAGLLLAGCAQTAIDGRAFDGTVTCEGDWNPKLSLDLAVAQGQLSVPTASVSFDVVTPEGAGDLALEASGCTLREDGDVRPYEPCFYFRDLAFDDEDRSLSGDLLWGDEEGGMSCPFVLVEVDDA